MTRKEATQAFNAKVVASVVANPTLTLQEIGKLHGVDSADVARVCKAQGIRRRAGKGSTAYAGKFRAKVAPTLMMGVTNPRAPQTPVTLRNLSENRQLKETV